MIQMLSSLLPGIIGTGQAAPFRAGSSPTAALRASASSTGPTISPASGRRDLTRQQEPPEIGALPDEVVNRNPNLYAPPGTVARFNLQMPVK